MDSYYGYIAAQWVSRTLPRRFCYWLANRVSGCFYFFDRQGRRAVQSNVRRVLLFRGSSADAKQVRRLSRATFVYFGKYLVDFFRYSTLRNGELEHIIEVEHPEYLREAAGRGKGVIALSAHFGNWEMGGATLTAMGYRLHTVVLPQRREKVNRLFQSQRRGRGFEVSFLGQSAAAVMRALRRGDIVGLLGDLDFSGQDNTATLFGHPARMPRGPAYLAHRIGAPILPGFVRRREDDKMVLQFYPPIFPEGRTQDEIQRKICSILEDVISRYPEQWYVFRDFWNPHNASPLASELPRGGE